MEMIRRGLAMIFTKRDFRNLMGAQFLAQAGDGVAQAALAKSIVFGGTKGFDLEGATSPDEILTIALAIFVPYTLVSPFLGVVIDRWDRSRLLFVANGLRALVIAAVGLAGVDSVPEGVLLAAFLLTLSSTRVVLATKAAALPATVEGSSLVEANAVSQFGGALFQLGGAGVALVASGLVSVDPIAVAGGLVYGAGSLFALGVRRSGGLRARSSFGREVARVVASIAAGVREVAAAPAAGAAITTYLWLRLLWSFTFAGIGLIARDLLGSDDITAVAVTGGAGAAGAALGFVLAARLTARLATTAHVVLAGAVTAGAAVAVLGALEVAAALAALAFLLGLGFFIAKISLDTMVQEALGDDFRGRAFSLYDIAYNLAWVGAAAVLKLFWVGVGAPLISFMGVVFIIGTGALAAWFRRAGLLAVASTSRSR